MKKRIVLSFILMTLVLLFASAGVAQAATIYVNQNSVQPFPDGHSWDTSFKTVQEGVNAAVTGDEVWVAKGTYFENITLKDGIALYGGFTGFETSRNQRDFKTNETILDGNETPESQMDENPLIIDSVVSVANCSDTVTRIDGFTIQRSEIGIQCTNSSPAITHNKIKANIGPGLAGAIDIISGSSPIVTKNEITNNKSSGIRTINSAPIIANNIIACNTANYGGGIYCYGGIDSRQPVIENNTISNNSAGWYGGAIYCPQSNSMIANNIITFNCCHLRPIDKPSSLVIYHNDVYGNLPSDSFNDVVDSGNVSVDPLFVAAVPLDDSLYWTAIGDFHIQPSSPCINLGDDNYVQADWTDIDGEARVMGNHVDIGADELQPDTITPTAWATPAGGIYNTAQSVTLLASETASIYYTLDGTTPTASSTQYTGIPIPIYGSQTLRFIAIDTAGNQSEAYSEDYIIDQIPPYTRVFLNSIESQSGGFSSDVTVTLSAEDSGGAGVASTKYSLDEVNWQDYSEPFVVSNDMTNTVFYYSVDNAGNTESTQMAFVFIDRVSPTVYAMPAGGIYNAPQSVTLADSKGSNIYYTTDGTTPTASSTRYNWEPLTISSPYTVLKFMAIDWVGHESTVATEEYIIDPTAPEEMHLCLCGQLGNNDWFITPVQFGIAATDSISGIASKEYSFNNQTWHLFNEANGPVTLTDDQTITIYYRATDNAGNTTTSATGHEVKIDKTAPITTVSLEGAAGNNGWFISDVTVTLSAWDNISGVAKTEYSFDGQNWIGYNDPFVITDEGITTVYYRSIDNAGNTETTQTQPLQVDPTPPPAEIVVTPAPGTSTDTGGWYSGPVDLIGIPGSDTSTIVSTEYSWDCNTWFTHDGPLTITDDGTWICYYKAVDGAGNVTIKSVTIKIDKTKPVSTLTIGEPKELITDPVTGQTLYRVKANTPFTLSALDPPGANGTPGSGIAKIEYKIDDGAWATYDGTFTVANGAHTRTIYYHAIDIAGNVEADNSTTVVINTSPVLNQNNSSVTVDEGQQALNTGTYSDADGDNLVLSASAGSIVMNADGTWSWQFDATDGPAQSQTVTITADDGNGGVAQVSFDLIVNNVNPMITSITVPLDPTAVNTSVNASASFTDPGILDTHSATWEWGDGTTSDGAVTETDGSGTISGSHIFTAAGVYTVKLTVTDKDGASDTKECQEYVVIYDPSAGFITGGGWINSPAGAYAPDPTLTGKATFGFVSKYPKGATVPTGNTEFQFVAGSLNFHSTSYEWLVVSSAKAQYKGSGTINGAGDYGFMLTAVDGQIKNGGGVDTFRMKIWDTATGNVVYDNQIGASDKEDPTTALSGGSIIIHS